MGYIAVVQCTRHAQGGDGIVGVKIAMSRYHAESIGLEVAPFLAFVVAAFIVGIKVVAIADHGCVRGIVGNERRGDGVPTTIVGISLHGLLHHSLHIVAVVDKLRAVFENQMGGIGAGGRSIDGQCGTTANGVFVERIKMGYGFALGVIIFFAANEELDWLLASGIT